MQCNSSLQYLNISSEIRYGYKAVAHTEGGAQGARPPYGEDGKYHNLKADIG